MIDLPSKAQNNAGINFVGRIRNSTNHFDTRNEVIRGLDCLEFTHNTISPIQDLMYGKIDHFTTPVNTRKLSADDNNTIKNLLTRQNELEVKISSLEARLVLSEARNAYISDFMHKINYLEEKIERLEAKPDEPIKLKPFSMNSIDKAIRPGQGKKFLLTDLLKNFQMKTEQKIKVKIKSKQT